MKRWIGFILAMGLLTAGVASAQHNGASVAGKWNVAVSASPHGPLNAVLELKQEGKNLTGNFVIPDHGDLDVVGEFADGKIHFSSTEDGYMQMSATGKLNADGTLAGNITSPMGEMAWTAKRAEGQ